MRKPSPLAPSLFSNQSRSNYGSAVDRMINHNVSPRDAKQEAIRFSKPSIQRRLEYLKQRKGP